MFSLPTELTALLPLWIVTAGSLFLLLLEVTLKEEGRKTAPLLTGTFLALALGAGLALMLWLGLSVANWVEVVFVSIELAAMLLVSVPDAIWGYIHHVAGGTPDLPEERQT